MENRGNREQGKVDTDFLQVRSDFIRSTVGSQKYFVCLTLKDEYQEFDEFFASFSIIPDMKLSDT